MGYYDDPDAMAELIRDHADPDLRPIILRFPPGAVVRATPDPQTWRRVTPEHTEPWITPDGTTLTIPYRSRPGVIVGYVIDPDIGDGAPRVLVSDREQHDMTTRHTRIGIPAAEPVMGRCDPDWLELVEFGALDAAGVYRVLTEQETP